MAFISVLIESNPVSFLWLYQHRIGTISFWKIITWGGEGWFIGLVICLISLSYGWKKGVFLALGTTITGLLAQTLKRSFFQSSPRPKLYFEQIGNPLALPENIEVHSIHSMPSGHTSGAFALCFLIIFLFPNSKYNFLWLIGAFMVGYSRVVLAQHFPLDVVTGAIIGFLAAILWSKIAYKMTDV